jgi:hypothetical protein
LTIASVIFIKFPTIFLEFQPGYEDEFSNEIIFRMKMIPVAWAIFSTGQLLFPVYYIRAIRAGV